MSLGYNHTFICGLRPITFPAMIFRIKKGVLQKNHPGQILVLLTRVLQWVSDTIIIIKIPLIDTKLFVNMVTKIIQK